jgi:thiol:disulfide interchange protein
MYKIQEQKKSKIGLTRFDRFANFQPALLFKASSHCTSLKKGVYLMSVRTSKNKHTLLIAPLLVAMLILGSCAKETEEVGDGLKWVASYDEAIRTAGDKDVPIMIDFYADWCGWCKRLDQDTYVDADVMSKAKKFISLKIDADVETDLASKYRVQGLPTILFIDHKGEEVHRVVGYRPPDKFLDEMDLALRAFHGEQGT